MSNHTETPWELNEHGAIGKHWNGAVTPLATTIIPAWHEDRHKGAEEADANAAFIIGAVNSHADLLETIHWMAQTFHQAHHQDHAGTWKECPKNTCNAARQATEKAESTKVANEATQEKERKL